MFGADMVSLTARSSSPFAFGGYAVLDIVLESGNVFKNKTDKKAMDCRIYALAVTEATDYKHSQ